MNGTYTLSSVNNLYQSSVDSGVIHALKRGHPADPFTVFTILCRHLWSAVVVLLCWTVKQLVKMLSTMQLKKFLGIFGNSKLPQCPQRKFELLLNLLNQLVSVAYSSEVLTDVDT
ncbi:hypothetical protein GOODEAATRI_004353 [Goodea atripinnis]|uniref:Uncharacterized protein n=1 Tax=Goodea atripinnis TaxID=208336 RepID=A0ABV0PV65_9TELE